MFVSDVPVSPSVFSPSKERVMCKAKGSKAKQSVGSLTRQLLYCVRMRDTVSVRPAPSSSYCQQRVAQPPADTGSGNARTHHHLAAIGGNACGFLVARWAPEGGYPCLFISLAFFFLWCLCLDFFDLIFFPLPLMRAAFFLSLQRNSCSRLAQLDRLSRDPTKNREAEPRVWDYTCV